MNAIMLPPFAHISDDCHYINNNKNKYIDDLKYNTKKDITDLLNYDMKKDFNNTHSHTNTNTNKNWKFDLSFISISIIGGIIGGIIVGSGIYCIYKYKTRNAKKN